MPKALINGVHLYHKVTGQGFPLIWSHEFAGGYESWDAQVRFFSQHYQVITYSARGYPPSDVPTDPQAYSQEQSVDDLYRLLDYLSIQQAYVGGLSMGGNVALNFGLTHPEMAAALIVAGAGSGSTDPQLFARQTDEFATRMEQQGMGAWAKAYTEGPTRVQLRRKDLKGWEAFRRGFLGHSALGSALTFRGVQGKRKTIYALEQGLRKLQVPTLIIIGDEDEPCLEPAVFMKRHIPRSGLVVFPQTGHTVNLEEPNLFNQAVRGFLEAVEAGEWGEREQGSGVGFLASTSTTESSASI